MKKVSFNEAMRRIRADIERGYPNYDNFEPWHCDVGTILPIEKKSDNQCIQRTHDKTVRP